MDFKAWKRRVDDVVVGCTRGVGCDDLPDFRYFDAWKAGASATNVAFTVLAENGYRV